MKKSLPTVAGVNVQSKGGVLLSRSKPGFATRLRPLSTATDTSSKSYQAGTSRPKNARVVDEEVAVTETVSNVYPNAGALTREKTVLPPNSTEKSFWLS